MRLVTYDRAGARRLGAWAGEAVVDLPDAVGHPAFPSTMESLVARHGGTTMDAARAAAEHPDIAEFAVDDPRLLTPITPTSVRTVPEFVGRPSASPRGRLTGDELEIACVLGVGGEDFSIQEAAEAIFGFTLVTAVTLGPTIVTSEWPVGLDHDGVLVGELLRLRRLDGRGLRPVVQPLGMMGDEGLSDPRPAEELAPVVEEHLVLVDVGVEERDAESGGVPRL